MFCGAFFVLCLGTFPIYESSKYFPIPNDGRMDSERIVGGTLAPNGSVPYQVTLQAYQGSRPSKHFCGASIITPRVILTAAHCIYRTNPESYKAVVGTNQLDSGGDSYNIRKSVIHENYQPATKARNVPNDIAILFTEEKIELTATVDTIELNDEPVAPGTELLLTGWGRTSFSRGQTPNNLMQLEMRAAAAKECMRRLGTTDKQICTFSQPGKGAGIGDSGGPLAKGIRLVGIVSYGIPRGRGAPDVFTKVSAYIDWIEQTLDEDDPEHVEYLHQGDQRKRVNYNNF